LPAGRKYASGRALPQSRRSLAPPAPLSFAAYASERENHGRQAELFYLQKQIQSRTPMVVVLEDGERIEGVIEWYDRDAIKVRGHAKTLVYKNAIKYMYKQGDSGQ
jgi:RNA chaperone Hfq